MRFIFVLLAFLPLSQLMAEPLTVANNCQQWTTVRQQSSEQNTLYWLQGFVAAYNEYAYTGRNPQGVLRSSDPKVITEWLDGYCQNNPQSNPKKAVESLIEEKKPEQKACPVKRSSGRPCIPSKEEDIPEGGSK
jgi:hypothetical protein